MDLYFKTCKVSFTENDLHLIGLTSIFIASKSEDIYPISLSDLYANAGHRKFKMDEIKQTEKQIMISIEFNLNSPTSYEMLDYLIINTLKRKSN